MSIRLRVRGPGGGGAALNLGADATLGQLKALIAAQLQPSIPPAQQRLRTGFPPQALAATDEEATLSSLQITNGESLVVEDAGPQQQQAGGQQGAAAAASPSAPAAVVPSHPVFTVGE
eukprot:COSAG01_NODE_35213_length_535_cov_1.059633_1_plen_117_part_01